jgi:hypothetical protein
LKHSDQSTENDLDGDVSGTSFQAGSIEINVGAPGRRWRRRVLLYLSAPAVAAVLGGSAAVVDLVSPDDRAMELPASVTSTVPVQTGTTSSPSPPTGAPVPRRPVADTVRPAPPAPAPRSNGNAPAGSQSPTTTTTTVSTAAAPPITTEGARYSGVLQFGSYHLDLPQPRDIAGTNVWPLTPGRLHGDPGYWLAEWITDGVPGRAECVARLAERSTQDAENLVEGSRVCGRTPEGRIFRIEVTALGSAGITGRVTVWELA